MVANVAAFAADPEPDYDAKVSVTNLTEGDAAHFYKIVEWVGEADGNVKGWKVVSPFNFDLNAVLVGTPASEGVAAVAATGITAELANTVSATAGKTDAGSDTVGDDGIAELDVSTLGAGIYMVLITPANTDVVYNPVFVCYLLNSFLHCTAYENIIFSWVMHEQAIIDAITDRLMVRIALCVAKF